MISKIFESGIELVSTWFGSWCISTCTRFTCIHFTYAVSDFLWLKDCTVLTERRTIFGILLLAPADQYATYAVVSC